MVYELLFIFPFSLIWGVIISAVYRPGIPIAVTVVAALGFIVAGFYLPQNLELYYWLPGSIGMVVISALLTIPFLKPGAIIRGTVSETPQRRQVREALMSSAGPEERQQIYLGLVQKLSLVYKKRLTESSPRNTWFVIAIIFSLFAIAFSALLVFFQADTTRAVDAIVEMFGSTKALQQAEAQKIPPEELREGIELVIHLSPAVVFIQNAIVYFILLTIMRFIYQVSKKDASIIGAMNLFRLPELFIFFFISLAALVATLVYYETEGWAFYIPLNALLITAFLYLLQGWGIMSLFFKVRIFPVAGLLAVILMISLFFDQIFLMIAFLLIMVGLSDFWFDFRNKALHPRSISRND